MAPSRAEVVDWGSKILPSHVEIEPPVDMADARRRKRTLRRRYEEVLNPLPSRGDLDPEEQYRRRFSTHTEVKLTYMAEEDDRVSAYLLIPTQGEPPFPGVIAHHQCNIDCDLGKEAVVGKVLERPDQAYGLELARRGFVVLAPDSKNCCERWIEGVRGEGECVREEGWKNSHCWGATLPRISARHFYAKHTFDSVRTIDYLTSLEDLVDPDRIGMIGHSLGAGTTFWTAAYDDRLKVAVASCHYLGGIDGRGWSTWYPQRPEVVGLWYHELLELASPTPFLATRGVDEGLQGGFPIREQDLEAHRWAFSYGEYVYDLYGVEEGTVKTLVFDGGHEFPQAVREECYEFIEKHLVSD